MKRICLVATFALTAAALEYSRPACAAGFDPVVLGRWTEVAPHSLAVSGDYAILVESTNLHVVNISNPASPIRVGVYATTNRISGVAVRGNYVYVTRNGDNWGDGVLQVIDVSIPANPVRVGQCDVHSQVFGVAVLDTYAYVVGGDLNVIDIANPASPVLLGSCSDYDYGVGYAVTVAGSYAFVTGHALAIVDVHDSVSPWTLVGYKSKPRLGQDIPWRSSWGVHATVSGNFLFAVVEYEDEIWEWGGVEAIDITFPGDPQLLGRYLTQAGVNAVAVSGNYAYLATDAGILVIDARDPTNLERVGANHEFPASAISVEGDKLYAVGEHGFFILQAPEGAGRVKPQFAAPIQMSRSGAKLSLNGPSGETAYIQRTSNLSQWENWLSVVLPGHPVEVTDEEAASRVQTFYRLMLR